MGDKPIKVYKNKGKEEDKGKDNGGNCKSQYSHSFLNNKDW